LDLQGKKQQEGGKIGMMSCIISLYHALFSDQIRKGKRGGACGVCGRGENCIQNVGNRLLGRLGHRWEGNMKNGHKEMRQDVMDLLHLA
jgi:hypothetical protein